jgi:hypothetical protein
VSIPSLKQPEVMFVTDVFQWSLLILFGSALLATFLGKVGGIFDGCFPDYGQVLKRRLAKTDSTRMKLRDYQERNLYGLKALSEIVALMEDIDTSQNVDNALRKKEILILLLDQTERELDDFTGEEGMNVPTSSSPRDLQNVIREEHIVRRILKRTIKERKLLEDEQKPGRAVEFGRDATGTGDTTEGSFGKKILKHSTTI